MERDTKGKLGIIGAMDEEVEGLVKAMDFCYPTTVAGMVFYNGVINGRDVAVVRSGVGKVNAAICTQLLVSRFHVQSIINTGIAGAVSDSLEVGDIVLSDMVAHHDVDATQWGYAPGEIPRSGRVWYDADHKMLELAQHCAESSLENANVHTGRIVSGDCFISDAWDKMDIGTIFNPLCVEMEGAAVAQAAYMNGVPFLIIRSISDKADGSATTDYEKFEKQAIENAVALVKLYLEASKVSGPGKKPELDDDKA